MFVTASALKHGATTGSSAQTDAHRSTERRSTAWTMAAALVIASGAQAQLSNEVPALHTSE